MIVHSYSGIVRGLMIGEDGSVQPAKSYIAPSGQARGHGLGVKEARSSFLSFEVSDSIEADVWSIRCQTDKKKGVVVLVLDLDSCLMDL